MGNFGRYVCVAVPFLLTLASLAALLVAGLAGIANKDLYMFEVNTTDLSISPESVSSLIHTRDSPAALHDIKLLGTPNGVSAAASSGGSKTTNITAADLGLGKLYDVSLWGYCYTPQTGARTCTQPTFNWATTVLNNYTHNVQTMITATGVNVTLPKTITNALEAFGTITRWTEIVFIIAYVALGVELLFGLFSGCSRAVSCITWIVAGVATVAVCAAAGLATAMAVVVVGTVEGTAKWYGVKAGFNTGFLAAVWIAAAFALASGFFWLFTICCCKPEHRQRSSSGKRHLDEHREKLVPTGAYQPLHEPEHTGFYNSAHAPQYGAPRYPSGGRSDLAYEPYSHSHV